MRIAKDTLGLAIPAAVTLGVKTFAANWLARSPTNYLNKLGPFVPVAIDLAALWAVPKYILKAGKQRRDFDTVIRTFLALDTIGAVAILARRGWSVTGAAIAPGSPDYPEWTDWVAPVGLAGAPYHPGHQSPYSHPHAALHGVTDVRPALPAPGAQFYDAQTGRWLVAAQS